LKRPHLRLDDREATELGTCTSDGTPLERLRVGRLLFQVRFGQQRWQSVLTDTGEDQILIGREANLAVTILLGQPGDLDEIRPRHPAYGDVETDIEATVLYLLVDANVVTPIVVGQMLAGGRQRIRGTGRQLGAETLGAELLDEVAHPAGP